MADEDPADESRILDVYKNASYAKEGGGNDFYNREHTWPNSYGFPDRRQHTNLPYTDCHGLFLSDSGYNSSRGNNPYRACPAGCAERPTEANNGQGGGTGTYPGNSNWRTGSGSTGRETWIGRRGDVARAQFYLDIRYEGGTHGGNRAAEPDLILTDDGVAHPDLGRRERRRRLYGPSRRSPGMARRRSRERRGGLANEVVYMFQGNRNPLIDHPEWVRCLFLDECALVFADGFESGDTSACMLVVP